MKLISPTGVRVSVSDAYGERLLKSGYRVVEVPASTPAPVKRTRRSKKDAENGSAS